MEPQSNILLSNHDIKSTLIHTTCVISSPNPMFYHLLESSHGDDSNKWSNVGFGEEIDIIEIKVHILSGALILDQMQTMQYQIS